MSAICKVCEDELDADGICTCCAHSKLLAGLWIVLYSLRNGKPQEAQDTCAAFIRNDPYQRKAMPELDTL